MKEKLPFIIAKPYSAQFLESLLETVTRNGLQPHSIYSTDKWSEIAREIYQKNVNRIGQEFKVGLEGHIKLVNYFFGNRAAVLLLSSENQEINLETALSLTQKVKRELRSKTPGGEKLEDIVVFMNLDQVDIGCDPQGICPTGIIGIQDEGGNFKGISKNSGRWDYYYFKYLHAPDNIGELLEELNTLETMGVLDPQNEISVQDFLVMAKLKTLIPPKVFR